MQSIFECYDWVFMFLIGFVMLSHACLLSYSGLIINTVWQDWWDLLYMCLCRSHIVCLAILLFKAIWCMLFNNHGLNSLYFSAIEVWKKNLLQFILLLAFISAPFLYLNFYNFEIINLIVDIVCIVVIIILKRIMQVVAAKFLTIWPRRFFIALILTILNIMGYATPMRQWRIVWITYRVQIRWIVWDRLKLPCTREVLLLHGLLVISLLWRAVE